ncbi:MAG: hypothetical protein IKJ63_01115 [Clostridia bacterium]|nr:hypothetical protein [Clostridia bacterium]
MEKLWILRIAHFFVDFGCAFLCLGYAEDNIQFYLLVYNFCAFALQMPLGLLVDRFGRQIKVAGAGVLLTAVSMFFLNDPLIGVIMAGLGNALFHVGGGVYVLKGCQNKCTPLGEFVAPGAVGLFLGGYFTSEFPYINPLVIFILLVLAAVLLFTKSGENEKPAPISLQPIPKKEAVALVLLFLVVVLRSAAGFQLTFSWKTGSTALLFAIAVMTGKELGGVLSDRFGMSRTSLVSLLVGAVLFIFSGNSAVCGILAVLCFNCTMPVTLFAAYKIVKGLPGFSFGLLTFALFLGLLPSYFGFSMPDYAALFGVGACVVSLSLLLPGLHLMKAECDAQ